ncbi:putative Polarized growth protein rax2 [Glarea lozoyensis 74030]|uniref:Putative Polarized growth protein rax2 n=1 Tax=Glarea lozoyensis (strain ATCC 74030 / MF5533) TaxID=1104152 RepID=H0ECY4_GLAL7|nr:putative Polarized growth protein rax2 [Glarea lozoyensis 74030]
MWVGDAGWTNLPFAGFNGPVSSITKAGNGNIIFGGNFTGLGNATGPSNPDQQIVNISGANITSGSSTAAAGFSDPRNILCKNSSTDGAGSTWLLADNTPGFWQATFGFGFQPTKLRLRNTHLDGRDPATGQNASCTSECPLSDRSDVEFQDFHFVNDVGMNAFRIDISAFYGSGGGLNGIELFQDDIFAYAINSFNEPTCSSTGSPSNATNTGPWAITPSGASSSQYLTAVVDQSTTDNVVFYPDIKQSGTYSVNIYTPGCRQDNSCATRGEVTLSGVLSGTTGNQTFRDIFQTNEFDKYDQIFFGSVDATSSSFRPSVTLSPKAGQNIPNFSVVAQRVSFILTAPSSTGGLNGIFEYDPSQATVNTADFANSTFDTAGMSISAGSGISSLITSGSTTFIGGDFSSNNFSNIFSITDAGATPLPGGSLNGAVSTLFVDGTSLYVGGNFTNTNTSTVAGLSHVGLYDTSRNTWAALGAGVDGMVSEIIPLSINISANTLESVITLSGTFGNINAFGSNRSIAVAGFATWVPSRNNWLQNIDSATTSIQGKLSATVEVSSGVSLFAGHLSTSQFNTNGAVELQSTSSLGTFPVRIQPQQSQTSSTLSKRATTTGNLSGVTTGLFDESRNRNLTILGGHFTANATDGSQINNLVIINNAASNDVSGVGDEISNDSTILALALQDDTLWIGGSLRGTVGDSAVNGLFSYNLASSTFGAQPPALAGGDSTARTIAVRPDTGDIYVGGSFESAGALQCPAVCVFVTGSSQWDRPGSTLAGIAHTMFWASETMLIAGGELNLDGGNISVAMYDAKAQNWTAAPAATMIPGPVTAMTSVNNDSAQLWVAGFSANGSAFVMKYDGSNWNSVPATLGSGSSVRGLQILPVTSDHGSSEFLSRDQVLLMTGSLNIPGFGNASAVVFNGTDYLPYALTNSATSTSGSLSQFFSSKVVQFGSNKSKYFTIFM